MENFIFCAVEIANSFLKKKLYVSQMFEKSLKTDQFHSWKTYLAYCQNF